MPKSAVRHVVVLGILSCLLCAIFGHSLQVSPGVKSKAPPAGGNFKYQLQNSCDFEATTWVWQEGFNVTKFFMDSFKEGLRRGPPLKVLVAEALAEFGASLDSFQEFVMDFMEGWIKNDLIEQLILELVYVEAQIAVAMTTGTAVCSGLLDQAMNLIQQLMENGICCILCEDWFWDQVTTAACELMEGMNHFIGVTAASIPNISVTSLKARLEGIALSFEDMILAAVDYPSHIVKTHSGGDFAEDLHEVRKAISTWAQSTLDAAFSDEATLLLEQLLQHLTEGSASIQNTIDSSTSSLVDWVLSSSCAIQEGNHGSILVNVTDEVNIYSWYSHGSIHATMKGSNPALEYPLIRNRYAGKNPDKLPPTKAPLTKCEDFLQIIPPCPIMKEEDLVERFPRLPAGKTFAGEELLHTILHPASFISTGILKSNSRLNVNVL